MKAVLTLYFILLYSSLSGQYALGSNPVIKPANCEDLVFNTRELMPFAYNTRCKAEAYPFISRDGSHLYFTNNQSRNWIFYTHRDSGNGIWSVPVPLEIANFDKEIVSSYLSNDNKTLYITTQEEGLYTCVSIDGSMYQFSQPVQVQIQKAPEFEEYIALPFSSISFTPDETRMYAYVGVSNLNMAEYVKTGDNEYTMRAILGADFGYMGVLGNSGLTYYFTDPGFNNLLFCKKRSSVTEEFSTETYIAKVFESHLEILQLRLAEDAKRMVMVLSDNLWDKNDIYFYDFSSDSTTAYLFNAIDYINRNKSIQPVSALILEKDAPEPIHKVKLMNETGADIAKIEIGNAFPNPAKNNFFIYYSVSGLNPSAGAPVLVLLDQAGRVVYSQKLERLQGEVMVSPEHVSSGVYYIRIDYNGLSSSISKITLSF